jgi:hypothetical protein
MYEHGRVKIFILLNTLLQEFLGLTPVINVTVLLCKVNIVLLLEESPQKLFYTSLSSENRQNKLI